MPPPVLQKLFQLPSKPAAVVVSLALVLLSAVMTLFLSTSVTDQLGDIARNYALRQEVDKVARLAGNIEMSRRGYLLTLDQSYLDLYRNSILDVGKTLSGLEVLTSGNPQQDARVKQIRALVEREEEDVRATVDLAQAGKVDAAMQKLRGDEGRVLMDQLSATVTQFINVEEQQLALRNARIDRMRYWITATSIVALISAVVLGLLLFTRVQRYARTLFEGQTALRSANELLEQRVRARTAELEEERRIAERERARVELLLQDTNHRIGNSLATVSSLLGLQMRQTASEDARAAHDDTVLGFADLAKRHIVAGLRRVALRLVDGRIDDRVGQRNVVAAQIFLIIDEVLRAFLVAVDGPFLGAAREARIGHVHVVRRTAHQAHRIGGDFLQPRATARQILPRAGNHMADIDLLARLGIRHQAGLGLLVLEIVDSCDTARRARECGIAGDVLDLAVVDPNLPGLPEAFQKLRARTCRHGFLPLYLY